MRIVVASDSFKGTLSSARIAQIISEEAPRAIPGAEVLGVPVADGGEGTAEALVAACGGALRAVMARDPLGRPVEARYGLLDSGEALVEVAAASGLPLLAPCERDAARTSSFGTGQLIRDALDQGSRSVTLALGGSATNDCGMGMMRALGARFLAADGAELPGTGANLGRVSRIDLAGLDPRLAETTFYAMCDVTNPLTGPQGATAVFGPQKGLGPADVERLDSGMRRFAGLLRDQLGKDVEVLPGAGAAGGVGAMSVALLGAKLVSGIERVLALVGFDELLEDTDLCVTGEGHADAQSACGKVVSGVGAACERAGVPCVAVVGGLDPDTPDLPGVRAIVPTVTDPGLGLAYSLERAEPLYRLAIRRALGLISLGAGLSI